MNIEIIEQPLRLNIHGFSALPLNESYCNAAFKLMDRMWHTVKSKNLKNKGLNIWVYPKDKSIFTGIELINSTDHDTGLEHMTLTILKYARYKHIGPYNLITQAGKIMTNELNTKGYEITLPYIEIYGHMTPDESKLETELIMCLT